MLTLAPFPHGGVGGTLRSRSRQQPELTRLLRTLRLITSTRISRTQKGPAERCVRARPAENFSRDEGGVGLFTASRVFVRALFAILIYTVLHGGGIGSGARTIQAQEFDAPFSLVIHSAERQHVASFRDREIVPSSALVGIGRVREHH